MEVEGSSWRWDSAPLVEEWEASKGQEDLTVSGWVGCSSHMRWVMHNRDWQTNNWKRNCDYDVTDHHCDLACNEPENKVLDKMRTCAAIRRSGTMWIANCIVTCLKPGLRKAQLVKHLLEGSGQQRQGRRMMDLHQKEVEIPKRTFWVCSSAVNMVMPSCHETMQGWRAMSCLNCFTNTAIHIHKASIKRRNMAWLLS